MSITEIIGTLNGQRISILFHQWMSRCADIVDESIKGWNMQVRCANQGCLWDDPLRIWDPQTPDGVFDQNMEVDSGLGNSGGSTIFRFKEGIESPNIADCVMMSLDAEFIPQKKKRIPQQTAKNAYSKGRRNA